MCLGQGLLGRLEGMHDASLTLRYRALHELSGAHDALIVGHHETCQILAGCLLTKPTRDSSVSPAEATPCCVVQLKQSLLSLHAITSSPPDGGDSPAGGNPLDAVMSTDAVAQTKGLLEELQQEEAALQQRLAEMDAVQQYEQVRHRPSRLPS